MPGTHASGFRAWLETRLRMDRRVEREWLKRIQSFSRLYSQSGKVTQTSDVLLILNLSDKHQV